MEIGQICPFWSKGPVLSPTLIKGAYQPRPTTPTDATEMANLKNIYKTGSDLKSKNGNPMLDPGTS